MNVYVNCKKDLQLSNLVGVFEKRYPGARSSNNKKNSEQKRTSSTFPPSESDDTVSKMSTPLQTTQLKLWLTAQIVSKQWIHSRYTFRFRVILSQPIPAGRNKNHASDS